MSDPSTHETGKHGSPHHHPHPAVTILVNNHAVKLPEKEATGREFKEAAIAQGVPIQLGFVLFRVAGNKQHPVRDDDRITVHEHEQFRCVDTDDNS